MPSIRGSLDQLQPLITASIALQDKPQHRIEVRGLIDTGATRTCLTGQLVTRLSLPPRGKMLVSSAGNYPERRRAYGFSLGLFVNSPDGSIRPLPYVFPDERVAPDFQDNDNFDVLIGMDVLCMGTLLFRPDQSFQFDF